MEISFWLVALVTIMGLHMGIEKTNGYEKAEEDEWFPTQYRLSNQIYYHFTKQKYLRFKEYWQLRISTVHFVVYTLILFSSYIATTIMRIEYSLGYKKFLMCYYFVLAFSPLLIDVIMWVWIRIIKNKRSRN